MQLSIAALTFENVLVGACVGASEDPAAGAGPAASTRAVAARTKHPRIASLRIEQTASEEAQQFEP